MNPDIQRIAEKHTRSWSIRADAVTEEAVEETLHGALTELSALRDTQDRALRERLPADWFEDASLETWFPLTAETLKEQEETIASLRAELTRRDEVEKELREKLEQTENMATEDVAYQNTHIIQKDQLITSLRAELARRDEVEKELREKLSVAEADVQTILSPFLKKEDELEEENVSLRSRIGELEAQVEDARNQWLERDT